MRKVGENITKKLSTQKLVAIIRASNVIRVVLSVQKRYPCRFFRPLSVPFFPAVIRAVFSVSSKRAERWLVEQRCRCADAMRMTLKVPIRMVLGVVEHICAIKPARMCWCHTERDLKYDCRRTGF